MRKYKATVLVIIMVMLIPFTQSCLNDYDDSYTKSIPSGHELWVQVEDYNGNKTEPVKIQTADELAKCTVSDPTQPDAKESTLTAVDG